MTLSTERLYLVPSTFPHLNAIVEEDWPTLSTLLGGIDFADGWTHFPEAMAWMRNHIAAHPDEAGWWNYLIIHKQDVRLIGTAGFKGTPDPDHTVEIGYEIADAYRQQGYASETAAALVRHAFTFEAVHKVIAQTLAQESPSVRLLKKLGFEFTRQKFDLEDGLIWEWALSR